MRNGFRVYDADTHVLPAAEVIERYVDPEFRPRLAELSMPLLVVQGTDDLVPIEASQEWAAHAGAVSSAAPVTAAPALAPAAVVGGAS